MAHTRAHECLSSNLFVHWRDSQRYRTQPPPPLHTHTQCTFSWWFVCFLLREHIQLVTSQVARDLLRAERLVRDQMKHTRIQTHTYTNTHIHIQSRVHTRSPCYRPDWYRRFVIIPSCLFKRTREGNDVRMYMCVYMSPRRVCFDMHQIRGPILGARN